MSGKNHKNEVFLDGVSMDSSFESTPLLLNNCRESSIQLSFSGSSPTGTFKLQSSDDITFNPLSVAVWTDVASSSQAITTDGNHQWKITTRYKWIRVVYSRSSGTGTCSGTVFAVEEP